MIHVSTSSYIPNSNIFQLLYILNIYYSMLTEANEEVIGFQNALKEFVGSADTTYAKKHEEFYIGFEGRYVQNS